MAKGSLAPSPSTPSPVNAKKNKKTKSKKSGSKKNGNTKKRKLQQKLSWSFQLKKRIHAEAQSPSCYNKKGRAKSVSPKRARY